MPVSLSTVTVAWYMVPLDGTTSAVEHVAMSVRQSSDTGGEGGGEGGRQAGSSDEKAMRT